MNSKVGLKILIAILAVAFGVGVILFVKNATPKIEYEILVSKEEITKHINDDFNIVDECGIQIKNISGNKAPFFTSTDENVAKIDQLSGNITCKSEGNCKIYIHFRVDENTTLLKYVNLFVESNIVYATNVTLEKTEVEMSSLNKDPNYHETNILDLHGCTVTPIVTYQYNLVTYDYITGNVYLRPNAKFGNDTVTIKLEKQDGDFLEISFKVKITGQGLGNNQKVISVRIKLNQSTILPSYATYLGTDSNPEITISNSNVELDLDNCGYDYIAVIGKAKGITQVTLQTPTFKLIYNLLVEE